jgi:hypothetical protein
MLQMGAKGQEEEGVGGGGEEEQEEENTAYLDGRQKAGGNA